MRRLSIFWFLLIGSVSATAQPPSGRAGSELFEKKIRPALIQHCYECHAVDSDDVGGDLLLDSRNGLLAGGETGPSIVPGKPRDSLLMRAIEYRDLEMPPEGKLPDELVEHFRRWIALGAPDPREAKSKPTPTAAETRPLDLWALHPVTSPQLPGVTHQSADSSVTFWPRSDADRFVLDKLLASGLTPNEDANPIALIRRVHFDLIGLPPSPDQVAAFVADPTEEHLAAIVDRLLSSPRFGEKWGRHWLDVARYGESAGSSRDVLMLYAWRYRDYVIDVFNKDVPFDRFVKEQVAGDLLPADTDSQRNRLTVATGLLAIGSKSLNGGNLTYDVIDDQIDVVSKSILGLTVSCARCHDHKFDPIPTADYYSLAGIFLSTDTRYGGGTKRPQSIKEKSNVYLALGEQLDDETAQAHEAAQKEFDKLTKQVASSKKRVKSLQPQVPKDYQKDLKKPIAELSVQETKLVRQYQGAARILAERQELLAVARKALPPEPAYAIGVQDAAKITDANVLVRGEKGQPGDIAPRGFLSAIDPFDANPVAAVDSSQSGRRQLADWLVHPQNPLTSRVAVNRIWQHLMGDGIVPTVDNFGISGLPPSHPELLDHLAHRFVHRHGWSTKAMIRELVLSRTYRLSSDMNDRAYAADPENRLRWRMPHRRLDAEQLRDNMLTVSGLLETDPPAGSAVMQIGEGEVGRNINTDVLQQPMNHRSVYLPIIRGILPEQLRIFDFPEPSNVQGLRDSNTTPTQSLYLMNSDFSIRVAKAFAEDLLADPSLSNDRQRIRQAHLRCFAVAPSQRETQRAIRFLGHELADLKPDAAQAKRKIAWTTYCQTLIASAPFRFID